MQAQNVSGRHCSLSREMDVGRLGRTSLMCLGITGASAGTHEPVATSSIPPVPRRLGGRGVTAPGALSGVVTLVDPVSPDPKNVLVSDFTR